MANVFRWQIGECCGCGNCDVFIQALGCATEFFGSGVIVGALIEVFSDPARTKLIASGTQEADGALEFSGQPGVTYYTRFTADRFVTLNATAGCGNSSLNLTPAPGYHCIPYQLVDALYCATPAADTVVWNDGGIYGPVDLTWRDPLNCWAGSVVRTVPACLGLPERSAILTMYFPRLGLAGGASGISWSADPFGIRPLCPNDTQSSTRYGTLIGSSIVCPPSLLFTGSLLLSTVAGIYQDADENIPITVTE